MIRLRHDKPVFVAEAILNRNQIKAWMLKFEVKQPLDYWGWFFQRTALLSNVLEPIHLVTRRDIVRFALEVNWEGGLPLATREEFERFVVKGTATQDWVRNFYASIWAPQGVFSG